MGWRSLRLDLRLAHFVLESASQIGLWRLSSKREQFYLQNGIHSVPAIIINERHLISGGQPVEVFEQALRQLAQ